MIRSVLFAMLFLISVPVFAAAEAATVRVLPTLHPLSTAALPADVAAIQAVVQRNFDLTRYREVRAQLIRDDAGQPDHLLVHLHQQGTHGVSFAAIPVDAQLRPTGPARDHALTARDRAQQVVATRPPKCPDPTVEFIAFCPNQQDLELRITKDVAEAARAHGLKTVELLLKDATAQAYLDYMSCPALKGNFYDGDSNPHEMVTYDGMLTASNLKTRLPGAFRGKVTNIWLACQAYNDPMLSTVTHDVQAQKYAAGINNLLIGPSDETGKCAMIAALDGQPMTASFEDCYRRLDVAKDHWGFGGDGADFFGQ
jgi:hypothetical protein